eukprot:CAMPEP_0118722222 /NCGR_PEP_ID=MMETSP0800-20121206/31229_1 /TAXON_ID=210618 ORGANISM="Striatella unipunctata, Strain CCMP2910" /NCGR_SAMPLE_ID=MMETSP0800 /ASSEMBLY_ACC=CAM_ASM_000638 /LENGTH=263 /DNA_ID=CAMNT_0006630315 /DNA_START=97 /DNA_END=888 /DNA_ORIENTATION=+
MVQPKNVLYCGPCGMPVEYCEYSPDFESHCTPWLKQKYPDLYALLPGRTAAGNDEKTADSKKERPWTTEERLRAFYEMYMPEKVDGIPALLEKYEGKEEKLFIALVKKYGPEPDDPYYDDDDDDDKDDGEDNNEEEEQQQQQQQQHPEEDTKSNKKKRRGVGAKKVNKVDTRVVIQKLSRNKKKAVTVVVGMETVAGVKLKDAAKTFSKRFAGSSSVKDTNAGKEIIIQGDHMYDVAAMVVDKFSVPANSVYLDIDGEFVPYQ